MRERLEKELVEETSECLICVDQIQISNPIFSCATCYTVFHLSCVEDWAESSGYAPDGENNEDPWRWTWKCPGCQTEQREFPYGSCFCRKSDSDQASCFKPHSCGQTCGLVLKCAHLCMEVCHAGPCRQCEEPVNTFCFCLKSSIPAECWNQVAQFACGQTCGKLLTCKRHYCSLLCHDGECESCNVRMIEACNCMSTTQEITCKEARGLGHRFRCGAKCRVRYECGDHSCTEICHKHQLERDDLSLESCPFHPERLLQCPCGGKKFSVEESLSLRRLCTDPIILCDKPCWKDLECGHLCKLPCHTEKCEACIEKVTVACRCGSTSTSCACWELKGMSVPVCTKLCKAVKSCGRHQCREKCCPRSMTSDGKDPHHCELLCGRILKCGNHRCTIECHRGPCPPCLEAKFTEISCTCGNTVLAPPIPCGSPLYPMCPFDCNITRPCGHPTTVLPHLCHDLNTKPCPPCKVFVSRTCACGKEVIKSAICSSNTPPSCGKVCGNQKPCGHVCTVICHAGETCPTDIKCKKVCGNRRDPCGHICQYPCHFKMLCGNAGPCGAAVQVFCACGNLSVNRKCGQVQSAIEASRKYLKEHTEVDLEIIRPSPVNMNGQLWCNAECDFLRSDENRVVNYSTELIDFAEKFPDFTQLVLTAFDNLLNNAYKFHDFPPMNSLQRNFVTELAVHYGILTEDIDDDIGGHTIAQKRLKSSIPKILISKAATLRKRGLLLWMTENTIEKKNDSKSRLPKGFIKAVPIPQRQEVELSNSFAILNTEQ